MGLILTVWMALGFVVLTYPAVALPVVVLLLVMRWLEKRRSHWFVDGW